ncbi:MAG TPA: hypothetical protein VFI31_09395 [Pirellulales bacterium]|nr:hypothetical protein [Pirellulales bacterium]
MATGLEMYDALVKVVAARHNGALAVNEFDAEDLTKLTADDLRSRGVDAKQADCIVAELGRGSLRELGKSVGVEITIEDRQPNLIPGEGIRRSAGSLADDEQTMEEMFEELDRIRHPERYAC